MYFDVPSLFTMVLLDYTVDGTLKRIYGNKKNDIAMGFPLGPVLAGQL